MYQRKDSFYLRAKQVGYRSRAAYKLDELARRYRLFRVGDIAVDLGAWPGGWLQVAARAVGPSGRVVGIDLQAIEPFPDLRHITTVSGDVSDPAVIERVLGVCGGRVNVVLSDMAPNLSGVRDRDTANAHALALCAIEAATHLLRQGGVLVVKLFMSDEVPSLLQGMRESFTTVRTTRPEATRKGSAELYAIATNFRHHSK